MMLAMQQSTLPHHDGHHVPASSSPLVTLSSTHQPRLQGHLSHMKQSRPRLSLNTTIDSTKLRSFGKGSSLRLDTLSTVSPTSINTFSNAYEPRPGSAPSIETRPRLSIDPSVGQPVDFVSSDRSGSSRTPSTSSLSSASTAASEVSSKGFYDLPKDVPSILVNSPIKSALSRMTPESRLGLGSKHVSFKDPLDEEIRTQKYILAHSDIESTEEDTKSDSSNSQDVTPTGTSLPHPEPAIDQPTMALQIPTAPMLTIQASPSTLASPSTPTKRTGRAAHRGSPRQKLSPTGSTCTKRDSSSDEDSDDSYTQTPVAGRCKRRRDWSWTLGPLPGYKADEGRREGSAGSMDEDSLSIGSRPSSAG